MKDGKDKNLVSCHVKNTATYLWVCEELCTYGQDKCRAQMEEMKQETRHCIDCVHVGNKQPCKVCISADPDGKERPFYKFAGKKKEVVPEKILNGPSQMTLS